MTGRLALMVQLLPQRLLLPEVAGAARKLVDVEVDVEN